MHRSGNQILDSNNNPVILRGPDYEVDQYHTGQMSIIKQKGCNAVAIMIGFWALTSYSNALAVLETMVSEATAAGLYVILRPFSMAGNSLESSGSNTSDWLTKWTTIASDLKSYTNIIYEPINEYLHWTPATYQTNVQNCIDIIRTYSPNALVLVSHAGNGNGGWPATFNFQASNPINRTNICFGCDPYGWFSYPDNSQSGIWNAISSYLNFAAVNGYPLLFTEFGGANNPSGDPNYGSWESTWVLNCMAALDANNIAGYFAFRWTTVYIGSSQIEAVSLSLLSDWNGTLAQYGTDVSTYYLAHQNPPPVGPTLPWTDNLANLNNFTVVSGTWSASNGNLFGSATAVASIIAGNPAWTDYAVIINSQITSGNQLAIIMRFKDSNNYYIFGLGGYGTYLYCIQKLVNGAVTLLATSGSISSVKPNVNYTIEAVVQGTTLTLIVNGTQVLQCTDSSFASGTLGIFAYASAVQIFNINATPITPTQTYIVNWAITPTSGTLPFTVSFSGYLSRSSNTPDAATLVNGETIQLQALVPGGSTWGNTGISATTGAGTSGNGYFSGTWKLAEPTIYPGAWQFRAYYAGNTNKYLFGCVKEKKTRDLRRVNALIL